MCNATGYGVHGLESLKTGYTISQQGDHLLRSLSMTVKVGDEGSTFVV